MTAYIAVDGNRIGSLIEALLISEDLESATQLSRSLVSAINRLEELVVIHSGRVVFAGGDNLLAEILSSDEQFLISLSQKLKTAFEEFTQCTASVGIGYRPRDAYLALKLAKGSPLPKSITIIK